MSVAMNKEILEIVNGIKSKKSIFFDSNLFKDTIENLFYSIYDNINKYDITFFSVHNIDILDSNMMMGIRYIFNDNYYYLILGSPSFYESIQQLALGKLENGNIYMVCENNLKPGEIKFVSFPESIINSDDILEMKCRRKAYVSLLKLNKDHQLNGKDMECLKKGLESFDCFHNLVKECKLSNEQSEYLIRRKKLNI